MADLDDEEAGTSPLLDAGTPLLRGDRPDQQALGRISAQLQGHLSKQFVGALIAKPKAYT